MIMFQKNDRESLLPARHQWTHTTRARNSAKFAGILACAALSGCSHNINLMSRSTALQGSAIVRENGTGSGKITVGLGLRQYSGRWVYTAVGGGMGFGTGETNSGKQVTTASATFVDHPAGGHGTVLASATDGSTLRCAFDFGNLSSTGYGVCNDSHGEVFDLQID